MEKCPRALCDEHFLWRAKIFLAMEKRILETLKCPITYALPVDPVAAKDGYIYESEAIYRHMEKTKKSPMTNLDMNNTFSPAGHVIRLLNLMVEEGVKDDDLDAWVMERPNRTEYRENKIHSFENGKCVRSKFTFRGEICFFDDDKHVRTEYDPDHPYHGVIEFFEGGKHVRTEFNPSHPDHGVIRVFEDGKHARTEYDPDHPNHGVIDFHPDLKLVRTEYVSPHRRSGRIDFIENDKHVRVEYAPTHPEHGCITFIENDKCVRKEFAPPHKHDGEIWFYKDGKHVRTEYKAPHPKHGIVEFKDAELVRKKRKRGP